MIGILDYGSGNLFSVINALNKTTEIMIHPY
jgi:imidazoleglycerol phosphate synthase glutamine amidotransferase subunit HisH